MAVFVGPDIKNDDIIFYVDSKNIKSFANNNSLFAIYTNEQVSTNITTDSNGFFTVDFKNVPRFDILDISNLSEITVNAIVKNENLKSGVVFSINNNTKLLNKPQSSSTTVVSSILSTTASANIGITDNRSETPNTLYTKTPFNTIANSEVVLTDNITPSTSTIYIRTNAQTLADNAFNIQANQTVSEQTTYLNPVTTKLTFADNILDAFSSYETELSMYLRGSSAIVTHRNMSYDRNVSIPINQEDNIFTVIFRDVVSNDFPISVYKNGNYEADSASANSSVASFGNFGISLFNSNETAHAQFSVRSVHINNRELESNEILLLNNLKET